MGEFGIIDLPVVIVAFLITFYYSAKFKWGSQGPFFEVFFMFLTWLVVFVWLFIFVRVIAVTSPTVGKLMPNVVRMEDLNISPEGPLCREGYTPVKGRRGPYCRREINFNQYWSNRKFYEGTN